MAAPLSLFVLGSTKFLEEKTIFKELEIDTRLLWSRSRSDKPLCFPAVLQGKGRQLIESGYEQITCALQFALYLHGRKRYGYHLHVQARIASEDTKTVIDFDNMVMYSANVKNKTCIATKMQNVPTFCLQNATFYAKETICMSLDTEVYQIMSNDGQTVTNTNISIAREFRRQNSTSNGNDTQLMVMQYFDLKTQIDDPTLFDIPDYCKNGTMHPGMPPLIRKYVQHGLFHVF